MTHGITLATFPVLMQQNGVNSTSLIPTYKHHSEPTHIKLDRPDKSLNLLLFLTLRPDNRVSNKPAYMVMKANGM